MHDQGFPAPFPVNASCFLHVQSGKKVTFFCLLMEGAVIFCRG